MSTTPSNLRSRLLAVGLAARLPLRAAFGATVGLAMAGAALAGPVLAADHSPQPPAGFRSHGFGIETPSASVTPLASSTPTAATTPTATPVGVTATTTPVPTSGPTTATPAGTPAATPTGTLATLTVTPLPGAAPLAGSAPLAPLAGDPSNDPHAARDFGPRVHLLHGIVQTQPDTNGMFVLRTEHYGDVTVSFVSARPADGGGVNGRPDSTTPGQPGGGPAGHHAGPTGTQDFHHAGDQPGGADRHRPRSSMAGRPSDLHVGDRVFVVGRVRDDAGRTLFEARFVHVMTSPTTSSVATHVVGTLSAVATSAGSVSLTLTLASGQSQTVSLSPSARILPTGKTAADLTAGEQVTLVIRDGTATGVVIQSS